MNSNDAHGCLKVHVGAVNDIDKMLDLLLRSRDRLLDVCRVLNHVIVNLPMIRHMFLKGKRLSILHDGLQGAQPFI